MDEQLESLAGKIVVLDTDTRWLYVGTLSKVDKKHLVLENVDAHDLTETSSTREEYLVDMKTNGILPNRKQVIVNKEKLVGVSLLEDIWTEK